MFLGKSNYGARLCLSYGLIWKLSKNNRIPPQMNNRDNIIVCIMGIVRHEPLTHVIPQGTKSIMGLNVVSHEYNDRYITWKFPCT